MQEGEYRTEAEIPDLLDYFAGDNVFAEYKERGIFRCVGEGFFVCVSACVCINASVYCVFVCIYSNLIQMMMTYF